MMPAAKWYELRIPMRVFLPIVFLIMSITAMFFFVYNLTFQLQERFQASSDTFAWSAGGIYLISAVNNLFIPVWRTIMKTKDLLRIYFGFIVAVRE